MARRAGRGTDRRRIEVQVSRVDYRPPPPPVGNLAVFSALACAPPVTERIQLCTPAYYRDTEGLEPGIGDARGENHQGRQPMVEFDDDRTVRCPARGHRGQGVGARWRRCGAARRGTTVGSSARVVFDPRLREPAPASCSSIRTPNARQPSRRRARTEDRCTRENNRTRSWSCGTAHRCPTIAAHPHRAGSAFSRRAHPKSVAHTGEHAYVLNGSSPRKTHTRKSGPRPRAGLRRTFFPMSAFLRSTRLHSSS